MIPVNQTIADAIDGDSRIFKARFLTSLSPVTELSCVLTALTVTTGGGGAEPIPSAAFSSFLEASVQGLGAPVKDAEIYLQFGVVTGYDNNGDEIIGWMPSNGRFTVTQTSVAGDTTNFTAVGDLTAKCQGAYVSQLIYPASIASILLEIETDTGCTVDASDFTLSGVLDAPITGTYAQALGIIAGLLGGFVTEDYQGDIVIKPYASGSTLAIDLSRFSKYPSFTEDPFTVTGLTCVVDEETSYSSGTPNVTISNEYMTQALFAGVASNYVGYSFYPATLPLTLGDPRLEPWDTVEVTDKDGVAKDVSCNQIVTRFTGALIQEITSVMTGANDDTTAPIQGVMAQKIEKASSDAVNANANATSAYHIAASTNQHYWFTGTGNDTGAHITEVTQEEWNDVSDPNYHAGGNLLARSNGIAVRDGMTELASFGTSGAVIGQNASGKSRTEISTSGMQILQNVNGVDTRIAHLGYGAGTDSGGGTSNAPYYTLGSRNPFNPLGNYSIAEGLETTASGVGSHSEGNSSTASGRYSHAEGYDTTASGSYSHAQNEFTVAGYDCQTAIGMYNENKPANLFEIGNGGKNQRSNAFEVSLTGNITASGKVTADAIDESLFSVSTESLTISASSTGAYADDTSISKSGYYPLAVAGVSITSGGAQSRGFYLGNRTTGSATLYGRIQATSSGSKSCTVYVLWVKNTVS